MLKTDHPNSGGLQDTLILHKDGGEWASHETTEGVQILHVGGDHWICISTIGGLPIKVADSQRKKKDVQEVTEVYKKILPRGEGQEPIRQRHLRVSQQKGNIDCGIYAIAHAVAWLKGEDPERMEIAQDRCRRHLAGCIEKGKMEIFPHSKVIRQEAKDRHDISKYNQNMNNKAASKPREGGQKGKGEQKGGGRKRKGDHVETTGRKRAAHGKPTTGGKKRTGNGSPQTQTDKQNNKLHGNYKVLGGKQEETKGDNR